MRELFDNLDNGDGFINLADAILALRVMAELPTQTPIYIDADVNGDGSFQIVANSFDLAGGFLHIRQQAAGFVFLSEYYRSPHL
jgi:hypothetical protein